MKDTHEAARAEREAGYRSEAQSCPVCQMDVHPAMWAKHWELHHPGMPMAEIALSDLEQRTLEDYERTIAAGLHTFYAVGEALLAIRDNRLYRKTHSTFEDYCRERWDMSKTHANRFIQASEVVQNLTPMGVIPETERQVRPLTQLPPEEQREAWQRAVESAPDGKMTSAHVQQVVDDMCGVRSGEPAPDINADFIHALNEAAAPINPNYKRDNKSNHAGNEYEPQGYDNCQTPHYAIDPLLPYLNSEWTIWEPACGEGLLVEALYDSSFYDVIATDILTGQNFFEFDPEYDCLITNPPFSLKYKWLERCYELGKPFALLLPVETLGAKSAHELFREHGIEVIFMDKRINFKMPNKGWTGAGAQFPVAWFTWRLHIGQQMTFARLDDAVR